MLCEAGEREAVGSGLVTVTFAAAVAIPPEPVHVSVYVVEVVGDTAFSPPLADTEPTPLLIEQEVAFEEDQVRLEELPEVILVGFATRETVGAGA
jgi:hypothetical protein